MAKVPSAFTSIARFGAQTYRSATIGMSPFFDVTTNHYTLASALVSFKGYLRALTSLAPKVSPDYLSASFISAGGDSLPTYLSTVRQVIYSLARSLTPSALVTPASEQGARRGGDGRADPVDATALIAVTAAHDTVAHVPTHLHSLTHSIGSAAFKQRVAPDMPII